MTQNQLIQGCKKNKRAAQKYLYSKYKSEMMRVCLRYTATVQDAEDILQDGFVSIFKHFNQFDESRDLIPWMRRIFINRALKLIRSHKNGRTVQLDQADVASLHWTDEHANIISHMSYNELLQLVQSLPDGYRMVFSMFVIDGYKHQEIADMLGISIGTSKSQLLRAKKMMKKLIEKIHVLV